MLADDVVQDDDVVGFHAQQAVEKAIKVVLVANGAEFPHTHDLGFLRDLVERQIGRVPESVAASEWLTPWAVAARYGASDAILDRSAAVKVADEAVAWAAAVAGTTGDGANPPDQLE